MAIKKKKTMRLGLYLGMRKTGRKSGAAPSGSASLDFSKRDNSQYLGQVV